VIQLGSVAAATLRALASFPRVLDEGRAAISALAAGLAWFSGRSSPGRWA
jgi:hypothetical protein